MMRRDRVGRGLVILGVAIAGPLGVLALAAVTVEAAERNSGTYSGVGAGLVTALLLGILVAYVILLVQMLRDVPPALGCGGLFGLLMVVAGVVLMGVDVTAEGPVPAIAYFLAMVAGGASLALGALLRLLARRAPRPAGPSGP